IQRCRCGGWVRCACSSFWVVVAQAGGHGVAGAGALQDTEIVNPIELKIAGGTQQGFNGGGLERDVVAQLVRGEGAKVGLAGERLVGNGAAKGADSLKTFCGFSEHLLAEFCFGVVVTVLLGEVVGQEGDGCALARAVPDGGVGRRSGVRRSGSERRRRCSVLRARKRGFGAEKLLLKLRAGVPGGEGSIADVQVVALRFSMQGSLENVSAVDAVHPLGGGFQTERDHEADADGAEVDPEVCPGMQRVLRRMDVHSVSSELTMIE